MLTKCIWCNEHPIKTKRTMLCEYCQRNFYNYGKPEGKKDESYLSPYNIRRRCISNMINKYGIGIIKDFNLLKKNPASTLSWLGEKYGFSRERARQLFEVVFNAPYTITFKKKVKNYNKDIACVNDPRRKYADYKNNGGNVWKSAKTEKMFFEKCVEKGLNPEILCNNKIDIKINGYLIDVKGCFSPYKASNHARKPYYHYNITKYQFENAEFIACYHSHQKCFYIIPINAITGRSIFIRQEPSNHKNAKNRYEPYKNAWHLLRGVVYYNYREVN